MNENIPGGLPAAGVTGAAETQSPVPSESSGQRDASAEQNPGKQVPARYSLAEAAVRKAFGLSVTGETGSGETGAGQGEASEEPTSGNADPNPNPEVPSQPEEQISEADPDPDADSDDPEADNRAQQAPPWWKKKQEKLKARTQKAEADLAEARRELEALKANQPEGPDKKANASETVPGGGRFDSIDDPEAIQAEIAKANGVLDAVTDLIDQLAIDPEAVEQALKGQGIEIGGQKEGWDVQTMGRFLSAVRKNARAAAQEGPARLQFLQNESMSLRKALDVVPELSKPDSYEAQTVQGVIKAYPQLRQRPDWPEQAMIYALGRKVYEERMRSKTGTPSQQPQKRTPATPPNLPGAPKTAQAQPSKSDELERLRQKANAPHASKEDRVRYTEALLKNGSR